MPQRDTGATGGAGVDRAAPAGGRRRRRRSCAPSATASSRFAFAGGSLLLELDPAGRISQALGAVRSLTGRAPRAADRTAGGRAVRRAPCRHWRAPSPISRVISSCRRWRCRCCGRTRCPAQIVLSGCRLPQHGGSSHLSLRPMAPGESMPARDPGTGLLERAAFEAAGPAARPYRRPAVRVPALAARSQRRRAALRQLEPEAAERVSSSIGEVASPLRDRRRRRRPARGASASACCTTRGRSRRDPGPSRRGAARGRPAGAGVVPRGATLDLEAPGLSEADAGKALLYAINSFARASEGEFTLRTLREGFDAMLQETVARIADYRGALDTGAFQLAFQPIVSLADRVSVHHFEALSRTDDGTPIASMVSFAEELHGRRVRHDGLPAGRRAAGGRGQALAQHRRQRLRPLARMPGVRPRRCSR